MRRARHAPLLALALALPAAACGDDGGDDAPDAAPDAPPGSAMASIRVPHYDYTLDLATRAATAILTVEVTAPGDCLTLDFLPGEVDPVLVDGAPARDAMLQDGKLIACDPTFAGWAAGRVLMVSAAFTVPAATLSTSQVGFSVVRDGDGRDFTYLLSWVTECDRTTACDSRPSQFATYRFTVSHPDGTKVLCPGTITAGATRTVCAFDHRGGPTYSTFSVMASPSWTVVPIGTWGPATVTLHDIASSGTAAAFDADAGKAFVEWMIATFGLYPYGDELRFAVGPTYWAGFEHPGSISLSDGLAGAGADALRHTMLHEVAHQWAGDQTTLADTYDFIWKESMAEYLSFVWEDEHLAPAVSLATAAAWKSYYQNPFYYPVPADDPRPALFDYYGEVYGPGPMVLFRQLEVRYGRPTVIAALKALLGQERAVSIDDVQAALEAATGADLDAYFAAWVRGAGRPAWPRARVVVSDVAGMAGMVDVAVTMSSTDGKARGARFSVRLLGAMGAQLDVGPFDFGLNGELMPAPIRVAPGFVVTGTAVDPRAEALVFKGTGGVPGPAPEPLVPYRNLFLAPPRR